MPGGGRATGEIEDGRCLCWSERRELVEIGGGGEASPGEETRGSRRTKTANVDTAEAWSSERFVRERRNEVDEEGPASEESDGRKSEQS